VKVIISIVSVSVQPEMQFSPDLLVFKLLVGRLEDLSQNQTKCLPFVFVLSLSISLSFKRSRMNSQLCFCWTSSSSTGCGMDDLKQDAISQIEC
jgi:hypothetical protein